MPAPEARSVSSRACVGQVLVAEDPKDRHVEERDEHELGADAGGQPDDRVAPLGSEPHVDPEVAGALSAGEEHRAADEHHPERDLEDGCQPQGRIGLVGAEVPRGSEDDAADDVADDERGAPGQERVADAGRGGGPFGHPAAGFRRRGRPMRPRAHGDRRAPSPTGDATARRGGRTCRTRADHAQRSGGRATPPARRSGT